jgi:hypothetical protein
VDDLADQLDDLLVGPGILLADLLDPPAERPTIPIRQIPCRENDDGNFSPIGIGMELALELDSP